MTRLRALVASSLVAAACGGGRDQPDAPVFVDVDAPGPQPCPAARHATSCNLLTQTGCMPGQKCSWVRVTCDELWGQIDCVPDGTVPVGGACSWGPTGASTGHDDCASGGICDADPDVHEASGTCRAICSLADATAPCPSALACTERSRLFTNTDTQAPVAGVCDAACDPLTQVTSDGVPACGSTTTPADRGCYGFPSSTAAPTDFACNAAGTAGHRTIVTPPIHTNSCAPGAIPMLRESSASMSIVCIAYCAPLTINSTTPAANRAGAPPYSCPEVGAPGPGERCQHLWFWEDAATPRSAASNAYGFCIDFTRYTWDHDMNGATPPVSWTLPETTTPYVDPTNPQPTEDLFWGAAPYPATLTGAPRFRPPAARGLELRPL